jgi:hypothetical protein
MQDYWNITPKQWQSAKVGFVLILSIHILASM